MNTRLALYHIEIRSRQSCCVSWICTTLFSCCVKCCVIREHMTFCRIWWYMQRKIINIDAEEYRYQEWPLWYTIFNSSSRWVGATDKDTLYSIFKVWTEKNSQFELFKHTESFESKILWSTRSNSFFKSKKTSLDRSDQSVYSWKQSSKCRIASVNSGNLIEVDGKGLVSLDRWLGVDEHVFPEV